MKDRPYKHNIKKILLILVSFLQIISGSIESVNSFQEDLDMV